MAITADLKAVSESYRLPDQLFLLLTVPGNRRGQNGQAIARALALAVLWELREAAMVVFHDGREIEIRRSADLDADYYRRAIQALDSARAPSMASRRAADLVLSALRPITETIGTDLERRGIVHHEVRRRFLLFPDDRWQSTQRGRGAEAFLEAGTTEVARSASAGLVSSGSSIGERRLLAAVMILESLDLLRAVVGPESTGQPPAWVGTVGRSLRRHYHGLGGLASSESIPDLADQVAEDFGFYQAVEMCATDWSASGTGGGGSTDGSGSGGFDAGSASDFSSGGDSGSWSGGGESSSDSGSSSGSD